jgi:hypothetical protein
MLKTEMLKSGSESFSVFQIFSFSVFRPPLPQERLGHSSPLWPSLAQQNPARKRVQHVLNWNDEPPNFSFSAFQPFSISLPVKVGLYPKQLTPGRLA